MNWGVLGRREVDNDVWLYLSYKRKKCVVDPHQRCWYRHKWSFQRCLSSVYILWLSLWYQLQREPLPLVLSSICLCHFSQWRSSWNWPHRWDKLSSHKPVLHCYWHLHTLLSSHWLLLGKLRRIHWSEPEDMDHQNFVDFHISRLYQAVTRVIDIDVQHYLHCTINITYTVQSTLLTQYSHRMAVTGGV